MTVLELLLSIAFHLDPDGLNTPGSLPTGFRILRSIGSSLLLATKSYRLQCYSGDRVFRCDEIKCYLVDGSTVRFRK